MKRRSFLGLGLSAAAGTATGPARAQSNATVWRMVAAWPRNAPGVGVNAQRLADAITAMSDERLTIKLYGAGELVPPFEVFDAVQNGTAEMGHTTPYYAAGKSPAFHFFTGAPFGLFAHELSAWLLFGEGRELWREAYASFGIVPFYAGSSGVQAGGWFNREITAPDDLKGLKFRIAGLGGEVFRKLGASVVLTPPGEIFEALKTGAIDGAEWIGPWNDIAFGLHKATTFYYLPAFHEFGPSLELIVNRAKYEALPGDLKAIVERAALATATESLADFTFHNIQAFANLDGSAIALRTWPASVATALAVKTRETLLEIASRDTLSTKVFQSYETFRRKASRYARFTDDAAYKLRGLYDGGA